MGKIYNKKEINKILDISVNTRGGGKVNLKPLASVADSIEGDISSNNFAGTNNDADEVLPIDFCYIECNEENEFDEFFRILNQNYGVNYYARNKKGIVNLLPLYKGEPLQLHEGQEVKNVMFPGVYEGGGDFMDLDYPNSFMDETVGLHQIVITNPDFSEALCSVSNKRLIALLATNKHSNDGGASGVPVMEEEPGEQGPSLDQPVEEEVVFQYEKASLYGIYVLYDINVENVTEVPPAS